MNLSSFDLNLLRVLDALLTEGTTVRAGARIGLSQPAVSSALGRLRLALNDPLFVRHGQRLEPTDYARSLATPLRDILFQLEGLLGGPDGFDPATAVASFKISGSDYFAELLMPVLAERLARTAPGVRVQLVDVVPDNSLGKLQDDDVDLALIPQSDTPNWIEWQPIFHSSFVVVARRGHPRLARAGIAPGAVVPLDLFCDLGHVTFSPQGNLRTMGDTALAEVGRQRRVVMTMPSFYGVCSAVAGSSHIALAPKAFAQRLADALQLETYAPPMATPHPKLGMVWHTRSTNSAAHRWLRGEIADVLATLDEGPGERA